MGVGTWSIKGLKHPYVIKEWPLIPKCVKCNQKELTKEHIFMVFSHLEADSRTALCSNDVSVTQSLKI